MDRSARFRTLLDIYEVLLGPVDADADRPHLGIDPDTFAVKWDLESQWLTELQAKVALIDEVAATDPSSTPDDVTAAMRSCAAKNRIPAVYSWVAEEADRDQMVTFLGAEGGPDGGFDDLVAMAQIGLDGEPKMELATNYWDEMGNGDLNEVHTDLHRTTSARLGLQRRLLSPAQMNEAALERACLGGLLATNHTLQPEMLGALGMIELQAGPRCRMVLKGMQRLGIDERAQRFYEVHADVDPRHGADWMSRVIEPTAMTNPAWAKRMVAGASWRKVVNDRFLEGLLSELRTSRLAA